eukprot:7265404-Heterocapsa_arctica.AAC.1
MSPRKTPPGHKCHPRKPGEPEPTCTSGFKRLSAAAYQSSNQTKKSGRPVDVQRTSSARHVPGNVVG